jgi:hypothetical protein
LRCGIEQDDARLPIDGNHRVLAVSIRLRTQASARRCSVTSRDHPTAVPSSHASGAATVST